jgi:CHRD domain
MACDVPPDYGRPGIDKEATVSPLRRVALSTTLAAVAGAAVAPIAVAGMHSKLAARLSGMGEHGIVNLTADAKAKKVCWTFDLPTTKGVTSASIHTGAKGAVLVRLGTKYAKKGCTSAPEMALEHVETTPGKYWVWVNTKGHPGDLRGRLFAGTAHM